MKNLFSLLITCLSGFIFGQNQAPQISNLVLTLTGNETLTIQYDLMDAENDDITISLLAKKSNGIHYTLNTQNATGDLNVVTPGAGKKIEWNFAGELLNTADYNIKLVAEDDSMIDIQAIVDQVDSNNLRNDLEFIEGIRHRFEGPDNLEATRSFMHQRFVDYGLNSATQEFQFGSYTGKNYIGTKSGTTDDEFIYICDAHYDTTDDTPGADDNGSGVVGFLEAARILSNYNYRKTIKFVGFDLEEPGLYGSQAYVVDNISPEEQINGVLNFEMIGYYSDEPNSQNLPTGFNILFPDVYATVENDDFRGNFIGNFGLENQNDWALAFDNAAATYVPDLKVVTLFAPENWPLITPDLGRSDHAPFWITGHPAVMLTGTANFRNHNYHSPSDTVGTLNFTFMSNVVKAAVATLAEQAEIHNSSYAEETINITVSSITTPSPCDFIISPNPASEVLSINLSDCNYNFSAIGIYDINAQLIVEQNVSKNKKEFKLDVRQLKNGIYILRSNNGEFAKRLVITH
jgi:hypothetical protein